MDIHITEEDRLIVLRALQAYQFHVVCDGSDNLTNTKNLATRSIMDAINAEEQDRVCELIELLQPDAKTFCLRCGFPLDDVAFESGQEICNYCWLKENVE